MSTKVHEIITKRLLEAIEGDVLPWHKPWKLGGLPHNITTNRMYTGGNTILLLMAQALRGYEHGAWISKSQIGTLCAMQNRNIHIADGEWRNSTPILVPVPHQKKDAKGVVIVENGKPVTITSFMYRDVWNVSQLANFDFSVLESQQNTNQPIEVMERVFAERQNPCAIQHSSVNTRAYYSPLLDYINMPDRSLFESSENYYAVLGHEIIHSTGAPSRLGRFKKAEYRDDEKYSLEELTAEFGTNFIMAMAGVEVSPDVFDNSVAYLQHWKAHLSDNPTWLARAASQAYKAAEYVFNQHVSEVAEEPEPVS